MNKMINDINYIELLEKYPNAAITLATFCINVQQENIIDTSQSKEYRDFMKNLVINNMTLATIFEKSDDILIDYFLKREGIDIISGIERGVKKSIVIEIAFKAINGDLKE